MPYQSAAMALSQIVNLLEGGGGRKLQNVGVQPKRCAAAFPQATSLSFGALLLQNVSYSFRAAFRFSFEPMPSLAPGC